MSIHLNKPNYTEYFWLFLPLFKKNHQYLLSELTLLSLSNKPYVIFSRKSTNYIIQAEEFYTTGNKNTWAHILHRPEIINYHISSIYTEYIYIVIPSRHVGTEKN